MHAGTSGLKEERGLGKPHRQDSIDRTRERHVPARQGQLEGTRNLGLDDILLLDTALNERLLGAVDQAADNLRVPAGTDNAYLHLRAIELREVDAAGHGWRNGAAHDRHRRHGRRQVEAEGAAQRAREDSHRGAAGHPYVSSEIRGRRPTRQAKLCMQANYMYMYVKYQEETLPADSQVKSSQVK